MQETRVHRFNSWVRKIPWWRKWQPTPIIFPKKIPCAEEPGGCSTKGHKESDMTGPLSVHTQIVNHNPRPLEDF